MDNKNIDLVLDTQHDLRKHIEEMLETVDKFDGSDEKLLIDAAEDSFSKLMLKTQQIYSETLSRKLESLETKEFIESKKENTSGKE